MKLELGIMAGPESKAFLVDLTKLVERMERAVGGALNATDTDEDEETNVTPIKKVTKGKKAAAASFDDEDEETTETVTDDAAGFEDEEEEDAPPAKATKGKKAAAASFDDEDEEEEEAAAPVKKSTKGTTTKAAAQLKKFTIDDVNDACKARVKAEISGRGITGPEARKNVVKLLQKKFDVTSVSELDPKQYGDVIKAMSA